MKKLHGFEMKCLRKIMNIHFHQHVTNEEVIRRIDRALNRRHIPLKKVILKRQLQWLGHIVRKDPDELTKLTLFGLVEGNRGRGRHRDTWLRLLLKEARLTRMEARTMALDRAKWRKRIQDLTF